MDTWGDKTSIILQRYKLLTSILSLRRDVLLSETERARLLLFPFVYFSLFLHHHFSTVTAKRILTREYANVPKANIND